MGTGYYLPDWNLGIERWSVDQLANEMLNEIQIGIGPDKIRAGIIGEIGIGEYGSEASLTSNFEKKVLQASAKVQKLTGVGISLHFGTTGWTSPPENWKVRLETINFLINQGVSANRIILGHCSPLPRKPWLNDQNEASFSSNYDGMLAALKKGVYLGIDGWGTFFRIGDFNKTVESYSHFASVIFDLIEKGYENNLVFSQDIYEKGQLVKNGGCGYAHIVRDVVPYLLKAGISGTRIAKLTAYNAQRFLTIQ